MRDDRIRYEKYVESINKLLKTEEFYQEFQKKLRLSKPSYKLTKKLRRKTFDLEWVNIIEDTLPNLDNIVRNPRKFIALEEDIVDISLARAISTESVKHLAQHTNMIASVDKDGNVTPNRILNITKEESFEVYENRFLFTLLKNVNQFITRRLDAIKASYINDHVLELDVDTSVYTGKTRVFYKMELIASLPIDEVKQLDNKDLNVVERITKIKRILSELLGGTFAKQMANSAPVRPPITRTNVILKNPDFKKALILWQFIESYQKMGFTIENDAKKIAIDEHVQTNIQDMACISAMLMEGLIDSNVEDSSFFKESLMDEKDLEANKEEGQLEVEKEIDQTQVEEAFDEQDAKDEQEEQEQPEEQDQQDNKEDEDDDAVDSLPTLNDKNIFQRTSQENELTKAEIMRINKAIDRVIIREKTQKAEKNIIETLEKIEDSGVDQAVLTARLNREKENIKRALARKEKLAEKERIANEKSIQMQQENLNKLEKEIAEAQLLAAKEKEKELSEAIQKSIEELEGDN